MGDAGKAPLFEGRRVPFESLDPGDFEACIFALIACVQSRLNLKVTGQPSGSGDGGFDVQAESTSTGRLASVQCKRQKQSLGKALAAEELAKVAATSALEGSDVGEHYFVCTGGVTRELRRLARAVDRTDLAEAALQALSAATEGPLKNLREQLEAAGRDVGQVVRGYVNGLDRLQPWSIDEFDSFLSPDWGSVLEVLGRYFKLASVVSEHPRPKFDREGYSRPYATFMLAVRPRLEEGAAPSDILEASGANPHRETEPRRRVESIDDLVGISPGETIVVTGDGGAGKSALLEYLRATLLREGAHDSLPVVLSCGDYAPGNLSSLINQVLGITHGTWEALPDDLVLLCDGINEAATTRVSALFTELKPLLDRGSIACIFTSRADSRGIPLALPTPPSAYVVVESLTPSGVTTLARHVLDANDAQRFVVPYLSLATQSYSPVLWTPFAVLTAIRAWEDTGAVPQSLGEMLDTVLSARASRDVELPDAVSAAAGEVSAETVLNLARQVAFHLLLERQQLHCDLTDAGEVMLHAKAKCSRALGIDSLSSTDIEGLLRRHGWIVRTNVGSLRFQHQLLAGALAAPILASTWRDHLKAIGPHVADDAWVLAARHLPEDQVEDYLKTLLETDLMLGARAANELSTANQDACLDHLEAGLLAHQSESLQVASLFAIGHLGTANAVQTLIQVCNGSQGDLGFVARRALAYSGHAGFLRNVLVEVDRMRAGGLGVSGGNVSIWEAAPLPIRLVLARERLNAAAPGDPVNESLGLVAIEENPDDLPVVETHFRAADDHAAWWRAFAAIAQISRVRAQELYAEFGASHPDPCEKVIFMNAAVEIGLDVDPDEALDNVIAEATAPTRTLSSDVSASDLIKNLISKKPISERAAKVVVDGLPESDGELRLRLWNLARFIKSKELHEFALQRVRSHGEDCGQACNYFLGQEAARAACKDELSNVCERLLADENQWFTFDLWRVMDLMAAVGYTVAAAESLSQMALRLSAILKGVEQGTPPELSEHEISVFGRVEDLDAQKARIRLCTDVSRMVKPISGAVSLFEESTLLELLRFDLVHNSVTEEARDIFRAADGAKIDEFLSTLKDPWAVKSGLLLTLPIEITEVRAELVTREIVRSYNHLAALNLLKQAVELAWNARLCRAVVDAVVQIEPWTDYEEQFFWDMIRAVAKRVEPANQGIIEQGLAQVRTEFGNRILSIWLDATRTTRVGLNRSTPDPSG